MLIQKCVSTICGKKKRKKIGSGEKLSTVLQKMQFENEKWNQRRNGNIVPHVDRKAIKSHFRLFAFCCSVIHEAMIHRSLLVVWA